MVLFQIINYPKVGQRTSWKTQNPGEERILLTLEYGAKWHDSGSTRQVTVQSVVLDQLTRLGAGSCTAVHQWAVTCLKMP